MEKEIQYHLEDFDGPLDLMLALVTKNKMSIYDIEIVTLIDQYLEVMGEISPDAMESASEFITMAARLVQMKSMTLLPKSEEAERMKEELTGLLVEYSACKEVAARLRVMADGVFVAVRRPEPYEPDTAYEGEHQCEELLCALKVMAGRSSARRPVSRERFDEIVSTPVVSVAGRAIGILRGVTRRKITRLREILHTSRSRGETVATFLALLELVRGGRLFVEDDGSLRLGEKGQRHRGAEKEAAGGFE